MAAVIPPPTTSVSGAGRRVEPVVPDVVDALDAGRPGRPTIPTAVADRQHAGPGLERFSDATVRIGQFERERLAVAMDRLDRGAAMERLEVVAVDHGVGVVEKQRQRRATRVAGRREQFVLAVASLGEALEAERLGPDVVDERRAQGVHLAGTGFLAERREQPIVGIDDQEILAPEGGVLEQPL